MLNAWAVGNRNYPEKIYEGYDRMYQIFSNRKAAREYAAQIKPKFPAVVFEVVIARPEELK